MYYLPKLQVALNAIAMPQTEVSEEAIARAIASIRGRIWPPRFMWGVARMSPHLEPRYEVGIFKLYLPIRITWGWRIKGDQVVFDRYLDSAAIPGNVPDVILRALAPDAPEPVQLTEPVIALPWADWLDVDAFDSDFFAFPMSGFRGEAWELVLQFQAAFKQELARARQGGKPVVMPIPSWINSTGGMASGTVITSALEPGEAERRYATFMDRITTLFGEANRG